MKKLNSCAKSRMLIWSRHKQCLRQHTKQDTDTLAPRGHRRPQAPLTPNTCPRCTSAQFYRCTFRVQVRSFTAVPSVCKCAVLPLYLPCTSAQLYPCIFRTHARSFTSVSSMCMCVALPRHMSLVVHKTDIADLADAPVSLRTSS